jgi:mitochondrial inner membrane protein COX18
MRIVVFNRNTLRVPRQSHFLRLASSPHRKLSYGIELTAQIFRSVHDLSGLPYGVTIPLTAVALRTIVTLPLSIYSQRKLNKRIELRPLFYQWGEIIGLQVMSQQRSQGVDVHREKNGKREILFRVQKLVSLMASFC